MPEAGNIDVFFSYAWANDTGNPALRDWCRKIADTISTLLSQRFNAQPPHFSSYLDRDAARVGQDLTPVLKAAVERSSVFVAMVSDFYDSPYCRSEVEWFCQRMKDAGLDPADHLYILRVQCSSKGWWPEQLKGINGEPLLYLNMCDANGQPLEMARFVMNVPTPELADPINKAVVDLGEKLEVIRRNQAAKAGYAASQRPPEYPIVFFEAEVGDGAQWSDCVPSLRGVPSIVLPGPVSATGASIAEFDGCDGLIMLRVRGSDDIGTRIKQAYLLRRQLRRQEKPNVPWVLLDEQTTPPPEGESFQIPRVQMQDGWVDKVKEALWG